MPRTKTLTRPALSPGQSRDLVSFLNGLSGHGIMEVATIEKKLTAIHPGLVPPKGLYKGWTVTKRFVSEVERSGGFLSYPLGTPITDAAGVIHYLHQVFEVSSSEQYGGRGRQYYSDVSDLAKALKVAP